MAKNDPRELTGTPRRVLDILVENDGRVVSHETLEEMVWEGCSTRDNTYKNVSIIRGLPNFQGEIVTKGNQGYMYTSGRER